MKNIRTSELKTKNQNFYTCWLFSPLEVKSVWLLILIWKKVLHNNDWSLFSERYIYIDKKPTSVPHDCINYQIILILVYCVAHYWYFKRMFMHFRKRKVSFCRKWYFNLHSTTRTGSPSFPNFQSNNFNFSGCFFLIMTEITNKIYWRSQYCLISFIMFTYCVAINFKCT